MRSRNIAIALIVCVSLVWVPTRSAGADTPIQATSLQLPQLTAEQWAGLPALVHWFEVTAAWTLADWYWWGIHLAADRHRTDWERVARCETGGNWHMQGKRFSGGVGFANSSWVAYGGRAFAPNAGLATVDQQMVIADRIQDPSRLDLGHCAGW